MEVVAEFFLALAVLQDQAGLDMLSDEDSIAQLKVDRLDNVLRSYMKLQDGTEALWLASGTRHYIKNCVDWNTCDYDSNAASRLDNIARILENAKDAKSTKDFEDSVNALIEIYRKPMRADNITTEPRLPII